MERNFRWLRLNQWIATKTVGWLSLTLYDKTQIGPSPKAEREAWIEETLRGKLCYGGLDLSTTTDLTAFVLLFPPQEGLDTWVALFHAWRPRDTVLEAEQRDHVPYRDWERAGFLTLCDGDMIDYTQVEQTIQEAMETYDLKTLGVDPYLSRTLTQRLMGLGLEVVEIPQTMMGMSPAMKEMERLIRAHQMLHVHNTAGRWCFGNVRCAVDGNENQKPMKNRSIGRIDITVAWIIAMATAMVKENAKDKLNAALEQGTFSF
jgi:phage terminase large subunit-like protein